MPNIARARGEWALVFLLAALSVFVISAAYGISRTMTGDLERVQESIGKPGWVPYRVGLEHVRLLLAAETGADDDTLKKRGTIYLGFMERVHHAPQLMEAPEALKAQMAALHESLHVTQDLLAMVSRNEGRAALLQRLRQDVDLVGETTFALSDHFRELARKERVERAQMLRGNIGLLQGLHAALLGLVLVSLITAWRWVHASRERDRQMATQASILKAAEDAIIGFDEKGTVLFLNERSSAYLSESDILAGAPLPRSIPGDTGLLPHVHDFIMTQDGPGSARSVMTKSVQTRDGDRRRFFQLSRARCEDEKGASGSGCCLVLTIRDITIEAEAARRAAEYESGIAKVSRVMSYAVIAGGLVHEISQPLAALRNYVHTLMASPDESAISSSPRMILAQIEQEADRVLDILRNVRLMGPQDEDQNDCCRLSDAVAQSVRLVSLGVIPRPAVSIKMAAAEDLVVKGPLPLLGQVIVNLLKNALQASSSAGSAGAEIFLRRSGGFAEIAVADCGVGVRPEAAARLFEPFSKSSSGGMGLGLAICKRIVERLGGHLSWENRDSGGALFTFRVPLADEC